MPWAAKVGRRANRPRDKHEPCRRKGGGRSRGSLPALALETAEATELAGLDPCRATLVATAAVVAVGRLTTVRGQGGVDGEHERATCSRFANVGRPRCSTLLTPALVIPVSARLAVTRVVRGQAHAGLLSLMGFADPAAHRPQARWRLPLRKATGSTKMGVGQAGDALSDLSSSASAASSLAGLAAAGAGAGAAAGAGAGSAAGAAWANDDVARDLT